MIKMKAAQKGHGGLSVAGRSYEPDKEGVIKIDPAHVTEAQAHGFKIVGEDDSDDNAGGEGGTPDYAGMRVGVLRVEFAKRFKIESGADMEKPALVEALTTGWSALKVGQLREAYKVHFGADPDRNLGKDDLVQALEAYKEE